MAIRGPRLEFAVGAFLILALASLLVLAFASTNRQFGLGGGSYELTARFANLGQLRLQAPVKIGGVVVGRVKKVELDPVRFDSIVTLAIDERYQDLPGDTSAAILTSGLLGESYIGLQPGGDPEPLRPGDEIVYTQPAIDLIQLVGKYMFGGGGGGGADPAKVLSPSSTEEPSPTEETP
jgi:ABC-type transport system involved in resistance to organic solvents, periplasmic component